MVKTAADIANERQARADKFYADGGKIGKSDSKKLHYSMLGGTVQRGDIVPYDISRAGYGGTGFDISDRYYQEAATRMGITVAQARQASAVGARTQSGKARDKAIRAFQDPTGKKEEQYQSHRALAKRTTASFRKTASLKAASETNEPVLKATSNDPETARANTAQSQYVADLRAGNVGLAEALTNPRTTQSYEGDSTVNIDTFLSERGYTNTTEVPDSIFKPVKYDEAREATTKKTGEMGDLESFVYQKDRNPDESLISKASAATQEKREQAKKREDDIINTPLYQETFPEQYNSNEALTDTGAIYETSKTVSAANPLVEQTRGESRYNKTPTITQPYNDWFRYSDKVDAGLVTHPKETATPIDDVQYYLSTAARPIYNVPLELSNLTSDTPTPIQPTTAGVAISGLIESAKFGLTGGKEGAPLEQTMPNVWKHISDDPIRFASELPAEVAMAITGGKAIQLGTKGLTAAKAGLLASEKTPQLLKSYSKTLKNYKNTEQLADDLYSKYPNKSNYNVEKFDRNTFLITAGVESAPEKTPAILVRYGKTGIKRQEKDSSFFTEYETTANPIKSIKIKGNLPQEIADKNLMEGVKQTGKYQHTIPVTAKNMQTISNKKFTNYVKPVGYEVKEKTSMLSADMRRSTMSVAEDPKIQKTNLNVLAETQALKKTKPVDIEPPKGGEFKTTAQTKQTKTPAQVEVSPAKTTLITKSKTPTPPKSNSAKLKSVARDIAKSETRSKSSVIGSTIVGAIVGSTLRSASATKTSAATSQKLNVSQQQQTKQVTQQITRTRQQQRTKTKLSLGTGLKVATPTPLVARVQTHRRAAGIVWATKVQLASQRKRTQKKKPSKDYIGNVRLDSVLGVYKRKEVTYGKSKISKLEKQDSLLTKKSKNRLENVSIKTKTKKKNFLTS